MRRLSQGEFVALRVLVFEGRRMDGLGRGHLLIFLDEPCLLRGCVCVLGDLCVCVVRGRFGLYLVMLG